MTELSVAFDRFMILSVRFDSSVVTREIQYDYEGNMELTERTLSFGITSLYTLKIL